MPSPYFRLKHFTVHHDRCAMKVTTDACLFGAWVAAQTGNLPTDIDQPLFLDIGAGTGLLSLMVAQKTTAFIDALEIDTASAKQAMENVEASPWKERINVMLEDARLWQPTRLYDCIFSNPPFYENDLKSPKENKNIAHHDTGLTLTYLFQFIYKHLKENGSFFLLLPAKREAEIHHLFEYHHFYLQQRVVVQQTLKHPPFRVMIQGRRQEIAQAEPSLLSIKVDNDYTPAFISLLKDYYLYL